MKTIPADLGNHIATRHTTLAWGMKITRTDGAIMGLTSHDRNVTIESVLYESNLGIDPSAIVTAANASVGNLEARTLNDGELFTAQELLARVWDHSAFEIFRYNYENISNGIEPLLAGNFGELELRQNEIVTELRGLTQYLQQPIGSASSKTCRWRLGSTTRANGGLCGVDLESLRGSGEITHVTSNQVFRDSARTEDADWYGEGLLTWTSGNNDGLSVKIKSYAANGTFTLFLPLYTAVQVGDEYTVVPGCRKRLEEDCRDKFDNVRRFGGEPHRPAINDVTTLT